MLPLREVWTTLNQQTPPHLRKGNIPEEEIHQNCYPEYQIWSGPDAYIWWKWHHQIRERGYLWVWILHKHLIPRILPILLPHDGLAWKYKKIGYYWKTNTLSTSSATHPYFATPAWQMSQWTYTPVVALPTVILKEPCQNLGTSCSSRMGSLKYCNLHLYVTSTMCHITT